MNSFIGEGFKRTVILSLERGDDLLISIKNEVSRLGIKNAVVVSGIGTFEKVVYHRVTSFSSIPEEEFITIEEPIELSCLQGLVIDGQPHLHMTFSDLKNTYSGHLEEGCSILYLAEVMLVEIEGFELDRVKNQDNLKLLSQRG
jgi:uncharacterized protein